MLISLAISGMIGMLAVVGFAWLMSTLLHHRDWWQSGGGSAFSPLQEFIQPQIRHVEEAPEQRVKENEEGSPDKEQ